MLFTAIQLRGSTSTSVQIVQIHFYFSFLKVSYHKVLKISIEENISGGKFYQDQIGRFSAVWPVAQALNDDCCRTSLAEIISEIFTVRLIYKATKTAKKMDKCLHFQDDDLKWGKYILVLEMFDGSGLLILK